jgi:peptidoglycan/LPS O-acetylase OafA/YrhL
MFNNYSYLHCLDQSWSVAVEFQLYIFAPLVLYAVWDPEAQKPRTCSWLVLAVVWALDPAANVFIAASTAHPEHWFRQFNR